MKCAKNAKFFHGAPAFGLRLCGGSHPRNAPRLLPFLRNPSLRVRAFVSATLSRLSLQDEDLDALEAAHLAGDRCALHSISQVRSDAAAPYLGRHLDAEEDLFRMNGFTKNAAWAAAVAGYLRSPDPRPAEGAEVVCFVASHADHFLKTALLKVARDQSVSLINRLAAVHAMSCIESPQDVATALRALATADKRFSAAVGEGLDRLQGKPTLRTALADLSRARTSEDPEQRQLAAASAIHVLGSLGPAARPALTQIFPFLDEKLTLENEGGVRLRAIVALGSIGDLQAVPAPAGMLSEGGLAGFSLEYPSSSRDCSLPLPKPRRMAARSGLRTDEGTWLGTVSGSRRGGLALQHDTEVERVLDGSVGALVSHAGQVLAVVSYGLDVETYAAPPGQARPVGQDFVTGDFARSSAIFRIEKRADGRHEAVPWKMLPGWCDPVTELEDGRLYFGCAAGGVTLRPDGILAAP